MSESLKNFIAKWYHCPGRVNTRCCYRRGQTLALSVFDDKSKEPTASELDEVLGETASFLKSIERHLSNQFGELTREWKFYGKKAGWTLALKREDRRILHLIPRSDYFTVVFTLGKRAVSAARKSDLPGEILSAIGSAREYAEGKSIRFDVKSTKNVATVIQLAAIKMDN
jgi:hypothetical protein